MLETIIRNTLNFVDRAKHEGFVELLDRWHNMQRY